MPKNKSQKIIIKDDLGSKVTIKDDGTLEVTSNHEEIKPEIYTSRLSDYSKSKFNIHYYDENGNELTDPQDINRLEKQIRKAEKKSKNLDK
tara:strand:- start:139 stop:411 length:273 start_codon:yes stop_codon:yes gene_type:complete